MVTEGKRYLVIAEKPYIAREIEKVYEKIRNELNFDADFASANCHIVDAYNTCTHSAGGKVLDLVNGDTWENEDGSVGVVKKFALKTKEVGDQYRVLKGCGYEKKMSEMIRSLVADNQYDAIVNACDTCKEGELKFFYTLESLGLERYEKKGMHLDWYSDEKIEEELRVLSEC